MTDKIDLALPAPIALVPSKTDAEMASEFKQRIVQALRPVMDILDEAHAKGLTISYAIQPSAIGKTMIIQLSVTKTF